MDRVPVHNQAASIAASARSWRQSIDEKRLEIVVPTATLMMWLDYIIQVAGGGNPDLESGARNVVMGHFARVNEELEAREDQARRDG